MIEGKVTPQDKGLIIQALQAAGYIVQWSEKYDCASAHKEGWKTTLFLNPLIDQGQAFQLAIEMGMVVDVRNTEGVTFVELHSHNIVHGVSHTNRTPEKATMRAIVDVAARTWTHQAAHELTN